jgi:hypothetical protein
LGIFLKFVYCAISAESTEIEEHVRLVGRTVLLTRIRDQI